MTGNPSVPIAIEVNRPTSFAGSSTVEIAGGTWNDSQTMLPSAFTPRRYRPTGHIAASRVCTCAVLIWAAPTAPLAIMLDVIPPVATATVPAVVIVPPLRPLPAVTDVTVP